MKGYIPLGVYNGRGRVLVGDFNRDFITDFIFYRLDFQNYTTYGVIIEVDSFYNYEWKDTIDEWGHVWAIGDFDLDGLKDIVITRSFGGTSIGFSIYESPDSFSYPTQEVWRDTNNIYLVIPIHVYDIDRDNLPEIFSNGDTLIYESINDNNYQIVGYLTPPWSGISTYAFGDFDGDGSIEYAGGNTQGKFTIAEYTEANYDNVIYYRELPTANIFDCFSVKDMDSDGEMEFIVKGFIYPWNQYNVFIFEAVGDNQYQIKKQLNYQGPGNDNISSYSCSGDVDADSIDEAILLTQPWIRILKANGDDNFYVWDSIYIGPYGGSVAVYDIDGNGLNEIIWSGNDQTKIYEWDGTNIKEEPEIPNPEHRIPTIVGAVSLPRNYEIFNIMGQKKGFKGSGAIYRTGIYFIKTDKKTYKIIKIR